MANGSSDADSRVTVAILETNMGHIEKVLNRGFKAAAVRDKELGDGLAEQVKKLNEVQVTLAVQEATLKQVATNETDIDALETDVTVLKATSQKWGVAGMGTSITAFLTAAYAAFKHEIFGQ